jgi:hypothetical protein
MPADPRAVVRATLPDDPDVTVAQVALGLTLYLDEPLTWARGGAAAALGQLLGVLPPPAPRWYKTSLVPEWHRAEEHELPALLEGLTLGWTQTRVRPGFRFALGDDPGAPAAGLAYHEVDDVVAGRTGVLQLVLPLTAGPGALLELAQLLGDGTPYWSGTGGYVATWNDRAKEAAFRAVYAWCKRCLGLDVQVPDEMAVQARRVLPGVNWITLIGTPLRDARDLRLAPFDDESVMVAPLGRGTLVLAGPAPTLGDLNQLEYPAPYAAVARALAPYLVEELLLYGPFSHEDRGRTWLRRFVEPEAWA